MATISVRRTSVTEARPAACSRIQELRKSLCACLRTVLPEAALARALGGTLDAMEPSAQQATAGRGVDPGGHTSNGGEWPDPKMSGARLGKYDLIAKLGHGGMAEVYLAVARGEVEDFRKLVVLKLLHEYLGVDQQFVEMFMREARISACLAHPNVVHTYTVGQEDGRYCIVMEYLDGVSLAALLRRTQTLSFAQRAPIVGAIIKVLMGLHYVHEYCDYGGAHLRLVHRDVKPGNIFLTYDGQVKVLDFGVAKMTAAGLDATASHVVKGTVQYMAPEALDTSRAVDRRADVFAAGLVLWEVARGQRLWGELNHLQILRGLVEGKLPPFDTQGGVPAELVAICTRALAMDPDARYASTLEFKHDLEAFFRGQPSLEADADALARFMASEFGDLRKRTKAVIKEGLAAVGVASVSQRSRILAAPSGLADPSSPSVATAVRGGGKSKFVLATAGAVSLLALAGYGVAARTHVEPSELSGVVGSGIGGLSTAAGQTPTAIHASVATSLTPLSLPSPNAVDPSPPPEPEPAPEHEGEASPAVREAVPKVAAARRREPRSVREPREPSRTPVESQPSDPTPAPAASRSTSAKPAEKGFRPGDDIPRSSRSDPSTRLGLDRSNPFR